MDEMGLPSTLIPPVLGHLARGKGPANHAWGHPQNNSPGKGSGGEKTQE